MTGNVNTVVPNMQQPQVPQQVLQTQSQQAMQQPLSDVAQQVMPQQQVSDVPQQQPVVDAQTYIAQMPNINSTNITPQQAESAPAFPQPQIAVSPSVTPSTVVDVQPQPEAIQQPKKNKLEQIIDFVKSDKCALWTGGILSTVALVTYALAPKRPPQPSFFSKISAAFSSMPSLNNLQIVQAFKNFVHNTRKLVF